MSAMASAAPAVASAASVIIQYINPIEAFFNFVNTNPYFIGVMMLLLNLGGRFLGMEVSKGQEKFFQHAWVRRVLIFVVLFIATRNVLIAAFLSVIIILLLGFLFNENSSFYLGGSTATPADDAPAQGLSIEETEILRRLTEKQMRYAKSKDANSGIADSTGEAKATQADPKNIYEQNISFLSSIYKS